MDQLTREEKLETALLGLIEEVYLLRKAEEIWHTHFGSDNRRRLKARQASIDKLLFQMGVDDSTYFEGAKVSFLKENLLKPATGEGSIIEL